MAIHLIKCIPFAGCSEHLIRSVLVVSTASCNKKIKLVDFGFCAVIVMRLTAIHGLYRTMHQWFCMCTPLCTLVVVFSWEHGSVLIVSLGKWVSNATFNMSKLWYQEAKWFIYVRSEQHIWDVTQRYWFSDPIAHSHEVIRLKRSWLGELKFDSIKC